MNKKSLSIIMNTLLLPIVSGITSNQFERQSISLDPDSNIPSANVLNLQSFELIKSDPQRVANAAEDVEALNLALTMEYIKLAFLGEYLQSGSILSKGSEESLKEPSHEAQNKNEEVYVSDEARDPTSRKNLVRRKITKSHKIKEIGVEVETANLNDQTLNKDSQSPEKAQSIQPNPWNQALNSKSDISKANSSEQGSEANNISNSWQNSKSNIVNQGSDAWEQGSNFNRVNSDTENWEEAEELNTENRIDDEKINPEEEEGSSTLNIKEAGEGILDKTSGANSALNNKAMSTREAVRRIREHTNNYISVLAKAIRILNGSPISKCTYDFSSVTSTLSPSDDMLMIARSFETMTSQVYNGFQGIVTNAKLREIISSMIYVQSAHKTFLDLSARQEGFTESFESIMSARMGLSYFKRYIVSCPFTVQGGTFRSLNIRPNSGSVGTKIVLGVMGSRSDLGNEELGTKPNTNEQPNQAIPTPIAPTPSSNSTNTSTMNRSPQASEYCLFISGTRQIFTDYNRGCDVPNSLPGGITYVMLVREKARVTATKIDHVLAGPAAFDVLPQLGSFNPNFPITNDDVIGNGDAFN